MGFRASVEVVEGHAVGVADDGAGNRLEVCPGLGFNAYRWTARGVDLVFRTPEFFTENRPSRSGYPILFPFPNRIRDGRFAWAGRDYALAPNDPAGKNAIHGFVLGSPWTPLEARADADGAELSASIAVPGGDRWPGDATLVVRHRLGVGVLETIAEVTVGDRPLPMGLGYHTYFSLSPFGGENALVSVPARAHWELVDNLPTGRRAPADLAEAKPLAGRRFDDALGDLDPGRQRSGDLFEFARIEGAGRRLDLWASAEFRDVVVFTPPHRQAICFEPYTCQTDAINLQPRGVDAGWFALAPGATWRATVRLDFSSRDPKDI